MKQTNCLRMIYKIGSKQLRKANWDLTLPLNIAMRDYPECVVSIGVSQCMRFIDEIRGKKNIDENVRIIQKKIKLEKKKPKTVETKRMISELYRNLYQWQFVPDYLCVIMANNKDYDRANKGFKVNGVEYRRLLGTNGGIKNSTIVYVAKDIYDDLKVKMDNGRKMDVPLVPAKLEAYQALMCSGSSPLPPPDGIIVVPDCITHFKEDVIVIQDSDGDEPDLSYVKGYEIEHNDSDGYGLMLPSYSRKVNAAFGGDPEKTVTGFNSRYAWTKGMVYTFDYIDFAEKVAGTYYINDVWGTRRDVRKAEVILTESMLKLWNCYESWEDYYENCSKHGYVFSAAKVTPDELENVRDTNYQFLQDIDMDDDDIRELCQPTIDEINDVLGLDYRKTLVFLCGFGLNEQNVFNIEDDYIKALMIEPRMIDDPYVRRNIHSMIKKRIDCAKKGSVRVNGNYAMIGGDPYALCQSMFGLPATGILKAGECYHKYWIDKGASEIVCFRAPMTCANNIVRRVINQSDEALYWYQYITTALLHNAWDSACDAMNGADKDGDTNMTTDNPVLLRRVRQQPTIMCMQRKAEKKIVNEDDIIAANKLAFNDEIGIVTNHVTSMIERRAGFEPGTKEYDELGYRIMCGQHFQQATIDRAKGVIAKSMPSYWYSKRDIKDNNDKLLNMAIVAPHKPYFMTYVYPALRSKLRKYIQNNEYKIICKFRKYDIKSMAELREYEPKTQEMQTFLAYYDYGVGVGFNNCVVNKLCRVIEKEFDPKAIKLRYSFDFDYTIMKCGTEYSRADFNAVRKLLARFMQDRDAYFQKVKRGDIEDDSEYSEEDFANRFRAEAEKICSNEQELCDIVLDLCYSTEKSKQFAWYVAGDVIIKNLLNRNNRKFSFPIIGGDEFEYCGEKFSMQTVKVGDINDNSK